MKQYYYLNGNTQLGPFTIDELRTNNLTPTTLVWTAGMADWIRASDVPELSSLFLGGMPPVIEPKPFVPPVPMPNPAYQQPGAGAPQPTYPYYGATPKPKNWLVESILATLFCCLPFGIAGIIFASRVDSAYTAGDINGAMKASAEAGKWTKISFFVAIGGWVLYMLFFGAALLATLNGNR